MKLGGPKKMKVKVDLSQSESETLIFSDLSSLISSVNALCERHKLEVNTKERVLMKIISQLFSHHKPPSENDKPDSQSGSPAVIRPNSVQKQAPLHRASVDVKHRMSLQATGKVAKPSSACGISVNHGRVEPPRQNIWSFRRSLIPAGPLIQFHNSKPNRSALSRPSSISNISDKTSAAKNARKSCENKLQKFSLADLDSLPPSQFQSFSSQAPTHSFAFHKRVPSTAEKFASQAKFDAIFAKLDQKKLGRIGINNLNIVSLSFEELQSIEMFVLEVYKNGKEKTYDKTDMIHAINNVKI